MKQVICSADELAPGQMVGAKLGPMPIVVVRTQDGNLYGLLDKCLHQGGQLSLGKLHAAPSADGQAGTYVEDRDRLIVRCPWHGYEYDVRTGCTMFDENRAVRTFKVHEEDGQIVAEA